MRLGRVQTGLNLLVGFVFQRSNLCLDACRPRLKFMGSPGVSVSQLYCPHSFDTRHLTWTRLAALTRGRSGKRKLGAISLGISPTTP